MAAADELAHLVGHVVDNTYRVEHLLGRGGMGAVFRAVHLGTDRVVALKVIAPTHADQPEYLARFSREARACGRLRHPGIVDVTDFGIATHNGRPLAYMVMEYLDGCTLGEVLRQEERPPLPWVIDILEQVCSCVEEAHRQGILHRDLKPENIWLEPNRRGGFSVKILDFGLAKLDTPTRPEQQHTPSGFATDMNAAAAEEATFVQPAPRSRAVDALDVQQTMDSSQGAISRASAFGPDSNASEASSVAGTPAYMSPEQTRGELVTARSDVYSIGVLAYRMIAGHVPFSGTVTEVLKAQLEQEPPPLRDVRADVHEDAARLIAMAMSKNPADRPSSAGAFGNMLAAQLEPAGTFFRRGLLLLVDRFGPLFRFGLLTSAPMIVASTLVALWQLGHLALGLPPIGRNVDIALLLVIFALSLVAQFGMGAMPIFVLHALAEPLRPLDVRALLKAYAPRLRRWLRAIAPWLAGMVVFIAVMLAWPMVLRWLGPWARQFARPLRVAIGISIMLIPFAVAYFALRRQKVGIREMSFLGAVMLIEDLALDAAKRRSLELTTKAGGLRRAVQRWYMGIIMIGSMLFGAYIGFKGGVSRDAGQSVLSMTPVLALGLLVLLVVNSVLGALMYLSARRATGESLEQIFADFERSAMPADRANLTDADRLRERIASQTTSR